MSSNEQHGNQGGSPGGWEPIPQSEGYDGDATAFVQLPPDFMLDGVPLEAPGHGYVPPMITPLQPLTQAATDPAATGTWTVHLPTQAEQTGYAEQTQYFDGAEYADRGAPFGQPAEYVEQTGYAGQPGHFEQAGHTGNGGHTGHTERVEHFEQDPHATAEWRFTEVTAPAASGTTGQWEIPVVPDMAEVEAEGAEPTEEPGEFAASSVRPYAEAPATLPGGAPAPWALPEEPAAQAVTETDAAAADAGDGEPGASPEAEQAEAETEGPGEEPGDGPDEPDMSAAHEDPVPAPDPAPGLNLAASTDSDEHPHTSYTLRVNGADRPVTGSWIGESLLYVLRERLGLAGAKDGCSQGECGACNVQVDGRLVASCLVPAATAAGSEVRTVEGLAVDGEPSDVQRAMAKCGTVQCGFCIPGMCMTVHDLLEGNHAPSELETRQALAGNLCRCSGYRGVLEAVRDVVSEREASAAAEASDEPRVPHQIPHPHDGGMA
ncbi:(2Fe-2S)-binding protein [Streptomyces sp. NBC_00572]|uniref:(2Fe-2S)-binding protein n=1 Tax=Streptomyces sp. NBC_00572 TaxID=2903664 RepID=UPI002255622D|nr:(2Fe-2S)-binding protein [Streptomyces sp. NBC_00572]MCX4981185.1 (2Fe-2S)-binding protein [Streptomyces sp. NBC_00572]